MDLESSLCSAPAFPTSLSDGPELRDAVIDWPQPLVTCHYNKGAMGPSERYFVFTKIYGKSCGINAS